MYTRRIICKDEQLTIFFRYRKQYLDSMIMKKVTFKLISTLFTLIAQTLIERQTQAFVSIQVSSNLLTSAALNYGIVS